MMRILDLGQLLFPHLTNVEIIEYINEVKQKLGTLNKKSNGEIIGEMSKFVEAEGIFQFKRLYKYNK